MIDRIGNSYDYQPQQLKKRVKSNTETFSMDYDRQDESVQVADTDGEKKEDSAIEALLRKQQEADGGVKVELSQTAEHMVQEPSAGSTQQKESVLFERFKNLWKDVKAAFVKFFTGTVVERVSEDEITVEATQELQEEEKPKSREQMRQELLDSLYENGEKKLARNSDLLTTYDKRGAFVQIDAGDKNRILHMHPNQIDETF